MTKTFKQIKRARLTDALVKSVLYGLALAALSVGGVMLTMKLMMRSMHLLYYIIIAVSGFAIAFAISLLITVRGAKRLAKELDGRYRLHESVQTMLEFDGEDGDMLILQREHTEEQLAALPKRPSVVKRYLIPTVALLLSAALLITAVVLPTKKDEPTPEPQRPFLISEWQVGAMEALIEEVSYAKLEESVKVELVTRLRGLLEYLKTVQYFNEMDEAVITAIVEIDMFVEEINTYKKVSLALFGSTEYAPKKVAVSIITLNGVGFGEAISPVRKGFSDAMYAFELIDFGEDVKERLAGSAVAEGEPLRAAVEGFADSLLLIANNSELDFNEAQAEIDKAFASSSDAIGQRMSVQYNNLTIRTRIIEQLIEIFMINEDDIPPLLCDLVPNLELESEKDDEGGKDNTGGYGEGNNLFGSDDTIYDTLFREDGAGYVKYGDVFSDYYLKVEELLLNGNLSEETKKLLIDYFQKLADGSKK